MTLDPGALSAIGRIFRCCDEDADGALSERELRQLHVRAFGFDLAPDESAGLLRLIAHHMPEGVRTLGGEELPDARGRAGFLLLPGFIFLLALLLERGATPANDGSDDDGIPSPAGGEAVTRAQLSPPRSGGQPYPADLDMPPAPRTVAAGLGGERALRGLLSSFGHHGRSVRLSLRASGGSRAEATGRGQGLSTTLRDATRAASPTERSSLARGDADRAGSAWLAARARTSAPRAWRLLSWRRPHAGATEGISEQRMQLSTAGRARLESLLIAYFAKAAPSAAAGGASAPPRESLPAPAAAAAAAAATLLDCDALRALRAALPPCASVRARAAAVGAEQATAAAQQEQGEERDGSERADADALALRALDDVLHVPRGADGRPSARAFATVSHVVDGVGALALRVPAVAARLLALLGFSEASLEVALVSRAPTAHGHEGGGFDGAAAELCAGLQPGGAAAPTRYVRCAVLDARACARALSQPRMIRSQQPQPPADDPAHAVAPHSLPLTSPLPLSAAEELLLAFAALAPARCGPLSPRQRLASCARPVRIDTPPRAERSAPAVSMDGLASSVSSSRSARSSAGLSQPPQPLTAHGSLGSRAQPGPSGRADGAHVCLCLELVATPLETQTRAREAQPMSARALLARLRAYDCVAIAFDPAQQAASADSATASAPAFASDARQRHELDSELECARALHAVLTTAALDAVGGALAARSTAAAGVPTSSAAALSTLFPPPMLLVRLGARGSAERGAAVGASGAERSFDGCSTPAPLELEFAAEAHLADAPFQALALCGIEDRATCAALAPVSAAVKAAMRARTRARISRAVGASAVIAGGCAVALREVGGVKRLAGLVAAACTPLREDASAAARALLDAFAAHARALQRQSSELSQAFNASLLRLVERAASELATAMPIAAGAIPRSVAAAAEGTAVVADTPRPQLRNWMSLAATGIGFPGMR
jgi:hypothetical protein